MQVFPVNFCFSSRCHSFWLLSGAHIADAMFPSTVHIHSIHFISIIPVIFLNCTFPLSFFFFLAEQNCHCIVLQFFFFFSINIHLFLKWSSDMYKVNAVWSHTDIGYVPVVTTMYKALSWIHKHTFFSGAFFFLLLLWRQDALLNHYLLTS